MKEALGERLDDNLRLWFTEHAIHGDDAKNTVHTVTYGSSLHQALLDVSAWVEKGAAPPASTSYKVVDGQVVIPATAAERKGIQPVVRLKANGGARAEVAAGEAVTFTAVVEAPPDTGKVVAAEWDFEGAGTFATAEKIRNAPAGGERVTLKNTHVYLEPGTYFATLRATSQRAGKAEAALTGIGNIGRVRVVVK